MTLSAQKADFPRVSNRCMVTGIVALSTTVLFMLTFSSMRLATSQQRSAFAGWLQAANKHVQTLRVNPALVGATDIDVPFSGKPSPSTAPSSFPKPALYPDGFRLSNLSNFTFVINNDVCGTAQIDIVMVVTSNTRAPSVRTAIRAALPQQTLAELRMRRVFLLAGLPPPAVDGEYDRRVAASQAENHEHGDLVSGHFQDAYRNLTYKHLMGLHWATTYCPQARYIVKMDDDIAVDVFQLRERLSTAPRRMTAIGALFAGTGPIRVPDNKWFVTREEFAPDWYPTYMSGWLYAITPDAAARLVAAAAQMKFFWVDDAFVTGVVRERALPQLRMLDMDQLWGRPDATGKSTSPFTMQIDCIYQCAAEQEASRGRCDTLVGPSWNNLLVMRMFLKQAEYCYRQRCGRRRLMPAACHGATKRRRTGMPQHPEDLGDVAR
ncbi:beta-1,3-galactosyltransferase 5-like isoform X1 [Pollicipes pollicipes]|uniref:beta-1,3-galactosyltransferase 5-like isoform X1 n=1 Tax=Pollicipes pollicipes TaxID=41117 RepID=UPI001884CCE4|nr:beta-1,3-galactosyltransferase 5-like isoform X1 [Pollicipes pollicipes]